MAEEFDIQPIQGWTMGGHLPRVALRLPWASISNPVGFSECTILIIYGLATASHLQLVYNSPLRWVSHPSVEVLMQNDLKSRLDAVLPLVQQPARYLGLERNLIHKDWEKTGIHVALAFPDAYEIGMSHQGSHILYHLVNRRDDALAERAFAPMPDMAAALRENNIPLYTLESYRPVRDFDVIGITLQTELDYINVPYLLELSGIATMATERLQEDAIVLGGGPCTANPEPVADFFDAFLIGDAEAALDMILDTILDARADGLDRRGILPRIAGISGVYVPQFYEWIPASSEKEASWRAIDDAAVLPVNRVWVDNLKAEDQPSKPIVPFAGVVQDRLGMEIMRGCTQGCRFCQAGYWYRPVREHEPETILERIVEQVDQTGFEQVGLLSLSSADYSRVKDLVTGLADRLEDSRTSISLPSLRADAFSVDLADAVSRVRKSGFTFAPETGSDRLRRVINKTFTNEQMITAAEAAFAKGWNMIKVYAMIGLPTETDDDLIELVQLARDLVNTGKRIRGRKVEVKVSIGCFVPKPFTPFQWQPYVSPTELWRRIDLLKNEFRYIKGTRLDWHDPELSALEALLARGDRRLAKLIFRAHELGSVFDGWSDHVNLDAWAQAIEESGINMQEELGARDLSATLPWDIIDAGVRKGYLKAEWRRALNESATEDCKWGKCYRCGIPGNGDDVQLAKSPATVDTGDPDLKTDFVTKKTNEAPKSTIAQRPPRRVRINFSKTGDARFLSHRQLMDALERALRAAKAPVKYTEGYNPHLRLSMGPALSLGHEGLNEFFDVECLAPFKPAHVEATNSLLPGGIQLKSADELMQGAPSLGKLAASTRYIVQPPRGGWPNLPDTLDEKIKSGVIGWKINDELVLQVELNLRQDEAPIPSIKKFLTGLGLDEDTVATIRTLRECIVLRPRARKISTPRKA